MDAGGKFKLTTDDNGIFGIEGNLGQVLTINSVEKQGYGIPPRGLGVLMFTYAPHGSGKAPPRPRKPSRSACLETERKHGSPSSF